MSENQYIPSIEEVTRMRHETGAGHGTSKDALIRARGDWTDAKRIIQYSGTVKIGAVLREIDAKRRGGSVSTRYDILAEFTPNGLLQYPDENLMADEIVRLRAERDALRKYAARWYEHITLKAAIDAALAVQPTTGDKHE